MTMEHSPFTTHKVMMSSAQTIETINEIRLWIAMEMWDQWAMDDVKPRLPQGTRIRRSHHHRGRLEINRMMESWECMMTSSNGNIFCVTGHLCGEFTTQRPVTRSFDIFFDLHHNKRLSKQSWGWWFATPLHSLWHPPNASEKQCPRYWIHIDKGERNA